MLKCQTHFLIEIDKQIVFTAHLHSSSIIEIILNKNIFLVRLENFKMKNNKNQKYIPRHVSLISLKKMG